MATNRLWERARGRNLCGAPSWAATRSSARPPAGPNRHVRHEKKEKNKAKMSSYCIYRMHAHLHVTQQFVPGAGSRKECSRRKPQASSGLDPASLQQSWREPRSRAIINRLRSVQRSTEECGWMPYRGAAPREAEGRSDRSSIMPCRPQVGRWCPFCTPHVSHVHEGTGARSRNSEPREGRDLDQ